MNETIDRGDTVQIDSKDSKYDGHKGVVYQVYEDYAKIELKSVDGVIVKVVWERLTRVDE